MISSIKRLIKERLVPKYGAKPDFSFKASDKAGLYIHYPFCKHICMFCPYHKMKYDKSKAVEYTDLLIEESKLHSMNNFTSLYIGGGTPSNDIDFLEKVTSVFKANIKNEISLEIHPIDAIPEKLEIYKGIGINFASLGVQSFDDEFLKYIGRNHTSADNKRALIAVTEAEFDFVDIDLVFRPESPFESLKNDFMNIAQYKPEQISVYPLMRFSYTGLGQTDNIPSKEKEYFEKLNLVASDNGYSRDTLWTYTLKDKSERFSSVGREFYLGLGMSSSSFTGNFFSTNTFSFNKYKKDIVHGDIPVESVYFLDDYTGGLFYTFWSLYERELHLSKLKELFPKGYKGIKILLKFFQSSGYLKRKDDNYYTTDKGLNLMLELEEWLTYEFIDPLWSHLRSTE